VGYKNCYNYHNKILINGKMYQLDLELKLGNLLINIINIIYKEVQNCNKTDKDNMNNMNKKKIRKNNNKILK
jgi:hypothetical protein